MTEPITTERRSNDGPSAASFDFMDWQETEEPMTSHDYRLALTTDRRDDTQDREARDGAPVKWSVCYCDNGLHGYPDRCGWVVSEALAVEDYEQTAPSNGHIIVRLTVGPEQLRDALIAALADVPRGDAPPPGRLREALYGPTADRLIEHITGAIR